MDYDYGTFLHYHENQLSSNNVPEQYWPVIYRKFSDKKFDSSDDFSVEHHFDDGNRNEDEFFESGHFCVVAEDSIDFDDAFNVFLSKHIFTFTFNERHDKLNENKQLFERLSKIFLLKKDCFDKEDDEEIKKKILDKCLFKFASNYCVDIDSCGKICKTFWYVLDEFGSGMEHSFDPNMKCLPFFNVLTGECFNLFWPLKDILKGGKLTRNYLEPTKPNDKNADLIKAMLMPWKESSLRHVPFMNMKENKDLFVFKYKPEDFSIQHEQHPAITKQNTVNKLKVYTDYVYIRQYLTDKNYEIIHTDKDADILWLLKPFYDYKKLFLERPQTFINQFPFENVLTLKDLFCQISRRSKAIPDWTIPTFDLQNELPNFVSFFQKQNDENCDNKWIIKPWNLSRSMETIITEDLGIIIKLRNSIPKIVSKYIQNPVLFFREDINSWVKFDLRFIVLLKSIKPLELFVYKNFWIRFANHSYDQTNLDDYQKHFTVMNYVSEKEDKQTLKNMIWQEFIKKFESQNSSEWADVQANIYSSIKDCFECSIKYDPPYGIGNNAQSRALYGIDVMFQRNDNQILTKILEINYAPDCKRACEYYPDFYNNIFNVLFLNKQSEDIINI